MSNSKNGNGTAIAKIDDAPVAISPSAAQASTEPKPSKNLVSFIERLDALNRKKHFFEKFSERLDELKTFNAQLDGSALSLTIRNINDDEIIINNNEIIVEFINSVLQKGEFVKKNLIDELLQSEL